MEKPNMNYAVAYQRFRSELNGQIYSAAKRISDSNLYGRRNS